MSRMEMPIHEAHDLAVAQKQVRSTSCVASDSFGFGNDLKLISPEQEHQVRDWAAHLGCSEQDLREAMAVVGNAADEVRRYLSYRRR